MVMVMTFVVFVAFDFVVVVVVVGGGGIDSFFERVVSCTVQF